MLAAIDAAPWLADGVTKAENDAAGSLRSIAVTDVATAGEALNYPWVVDGITPADAWHLLQIWIMLDSDLELGRAVLDSWWLADGLTTMEGRALESFTQLARENPELGRETLRQPFMEPPFRFRDEDALALLVHLNRTSEPGDPPSGLLARLQEQPWFADGLDDLETALLALLANSPQDFQQSLMETPHIAAKSIELPFSGSVDLIVVRSRPAPPEDAALAAMEAGARTIESFMGAPFPLTDLLLLVTDPEIWDVPGSSIFYGSWGQGTPIYLRAYMIVNGHPSGPSKSTIYHELAHYYYLISHSWLEEGTANFLETYTLGQGDAAWLEQRLTHLDARPNCQRDHIQQHLDDYGGRQCNYDLGERFLLAMQFAIGPEATAAALRELYALSLYAVPLSEDLIHYAFKTSTPPGRQDDFDRVYRRYHGGTPTYASAPDNPDFLPLMALYMATAGDSWLYRREWQGAKPLEAWHGVEITPEGRVRRLNLGRNRLEGQIPPELGRLAELEYLYLDGNELSGQIPAELGSLTAISELVLSDNRLTGEIPPELARLGKLQRLLLEGNDFSGCIPQELQAVPENDLDRLGLPFCPDP